MKHPLLPATALVALVILVCEGFFGLFGKWCDPARNESHYSHYVADENWMRVHVSDIPSERSNSVQALCDVLEIADSNGNSHICKGKILLYIQKPTTINYGYELLILATPDIPSADDNPHQFNYRQHLRRKGILFTDYLPSYSYRIVGNSTSGLKGTVATVRQRLIDVIHLSSLSTTQQGIAEALFLGWDDDLSPETEANFRSAGITHLLCVSGLHVGIVALLVGYCMFFLSNRRRSRIIKGLIQIAAIWLFVLLTGMAPGTMRAGLMFTLVVIGQMFFSRPPTLNAIAASALILLVANPLLLFDASFQMSYCSVIGIVLFTRPLEELIPLPEAEGKVGRLLCSLLRKLRTLVCVSFVAQCSILPILLYHFHQFSPYFLVANTIIIPFAALLLGSVMVMVALAWWPWAFKVVGALLSAELSATEWVTSSVASWPNALIEHIYCDIAILVLSFAILAALGYALLRRKIWGLTTVLALALILTLHTRNIESQRSQQRHFDVYNIGNRTAIEFFAGHNSYLLCDSIIAANPEKIDFQTENNLIYRKAKRKHILTLDTMFDDGLLVVNNRFVGFNNRTIRIIDRSNYKERSAFRPRVDYLLLRESPYITISELRQQYDFDTVIIASQNSKRRHSAWKTECDSLKINIME